MLAKLGHKVMSLNRVAVGPISIKGLSSGECRSLSRHEVDLLWKVATGAVLSLPRFLEGGPPSRPPRDSNRHPKREHGRAGRDHSGPQRKRHRDSLLEPGPPRGSKQGRPPMPPRANQTQPPRSRPPDAASRNVPPPPGAPGRKPAENRRSSSPMRIGPPDQAKRPGVTKQPLPTPPLGKRRIIGLELEGPTLPGPHSNRERDRKRPPPRKHRPSPTAPIKRPIVPFQPPGPDGKDA